MKMKFDAVIAEHKEKAFYRKGNKFIKLFSKKYSKDDIISEALCQARVEKIAVNVPPMLEVRKIGRGWAIISKFIEGKTLEQLMRENPDRQDEYLELFVDLQMKIHSERVSLLGKLKDKMNRKIGETSLDVNTKYALHTRLEQLPKHNKVCHGDFCPSNIIIGDDGKTYVVDWAHVTQGNASADVARTYLLFCLKGEREYADKYLDLFCEKSSTERAYVEKWLPIVAAVQSVSGKPEEKEELLKWVYKAELTESTVDMIEV